MESAVFLCQQFIDFDSKKMQIIMKVMEISLRYRLSTDCNEMTSAVAAVTAMSKEETEKSVS